MLFSKQKLNILFIEYTLYFELDDFKYQHVNPLHKRKENEFLFKLNN